MSFWREKCRLTWYLHAAIFTIVLPLCTSFAADSFSWMLLTPTFHHTYILWPPKGELVKVICYSHYSSVFQAKEVLLPFSILHVQ